MNTQNLFSQSWSEVTSGERNNLVFEQLNKNYGAYQIRVNYDRTLIIVFSSIGLLTLLLSALLMFAGSGAVPAIKIPVLDPGIFTQQRITEIFIPKTPEAPKIPSSPKTNNVLVPEVGKDSAQTDPENIIPKNNNNTATGAPCDTCDQEHGLIPSGPGTGPVTKEPEKVFGLDGVDVMPEFPGGAAEMYRFLGASAHIPEVITEMGNIREKVGVEFTIDKDGSITDVTLSKSSKFEELNAEALRVVKKMPNWQPGKQHGNPVKVRLIIPLRFEVK